MIHIDKNLICIIDGKEISKNEVDRWNIEHLCIKNLNTYKVAFVGLIIRENYILMSFPKNYNIKDKIDLTKSIQDIISVIINEYKNKEFRIDQFGDNNEFPIKDYIDILSYYKKYGLYKQKKYKFSTGYGNLIDWIRTINKSEKIIQKSGVIFNPFITIKKENIHVFLSHCMDYILDDALQYKQYISLIEPYNKYFKHVSFDSNTLVDKLSHLKGVIFKDIDRKLIDNMINYIKWKSKYKNNWSMVTTNFHVFWEKLVNIYLSYCVIGEDFLIYSGNKKNFNFKSIEDYVEKDYVLNFLHKHYKIKYDHICVDEKNKIVYIFDSKYYSNVDDLNYKQLFYHYHLNSKYPNYKIINGLIIPSSINKHKVHIDRKNIDGVKITEYYVTYDEILKTYFSTIK